MDQKFKILIISLSGMGDVLLFTPALHILRKRLPNAEINMLVKSNAAAQVLIGNSDIDHVQVFDPKSASIYQNIRFYRKQRKERYDLSISTFPALTPPNNLSTRFIGAKHRWTHRPQHSGSLAFLQNHTIPYHHGQHRVVYNMQLVDAVIHDLENRPSNGHAQSPPRNLNAIRLFYYISPEEKTFAQRFLQELSTNQPKPLEREASKIKSPYKTPCWIGIHPGSGSDQSFKRWSEKKCAALASMLQTKFGSQILLFGGPEEVTIAERIAGHMPIPPIIVAGRISLRHMAALIKQCRLFISNDSGLMHLAVALGTEVVGIFGPTDETNTAPIGKKDKVVLLSHLPCKPDCRKRFLFDKYCPNQFRCLKELGANLVLDVIVENNLCQINATRSDYSKNS